MPDRHHPSDRVALAKLVLQTRDAIEQQDEIAREALLAAFMSAAWLERRVFEQ